MKAIKITYIFALVFVLLQSHVWSQTQGTPPLFTFFKDGITSPEGIAIDAQGNVLAHSEAISRTDAIQYDANGVLLDQIIFGDGIFEKTRFIGSRFSYDPFLNLIIMLTPEGDIFQIQPDGLQVSPPVMSIPPEAVSTNQVYDIHTGQTVSIALSLDTLLRYGDLALFRPSASPEQLQLIVTGTVESLVSDPPLPFVMAMILDPLSGIIAAQLVLTSSATAFTIESRTRGVAVNEQGIGLTTLPISDPLNPGETTEVAVTFQVHTAPGATALLPQPVILFNGLDVTSDGMASDQAGHFYAASGDRGSSACEPNRSGALIVIPVDINGLPLDTAPLANAEPAEPAPLGILNPLACFPIATTMDDIVSSRDVAVSPLDQRVMLTVNNQDLILMILQP